jgi:hypothetical protein
MALFKCVILVFIITTFSLPFEGWKKNILESPWLSFPSYSFSDRTVTLPVVPSKQGAPLPNSPAETLPVTGCTLHKTTIKCLLF